VSPPPLEHLLLQAAHPAITMDPISSSLHNIGPREHVPCI
jgi:hypothetical protein